MTQEQQAQTVERKGREGSKWWNVRPTAEEFGDWFKTVPLHDEMQHEDFIGGITLIQQKEKVQEVVGFDQHGAPLIREIQHVVHIPYPRIDTRVAYFWKWVGAHPDWVGIIEPSVEPGQQDGRLPFGFFNYGITDQKNKAVHYIGASMKVRILERATVLWRDVTVTGRDGKPHTRRVAEGKPVFDFPPASKIVPILGRYEADHFALMKAESGAVGRALGMAGVLVLGGGIATAEDMQETAAPGPSVQAGGEGAQLPADLPTDVAAPQADTSTPEALAARITTLLAELDDDYPEALKGFQEWARGRGLKSLDGLSAAQMKGVVKKLEHVLDEAKHPPTTPEPESDGDAEPAAAA